VWIAIPRVSVIDGVVTLEGNVASVPERLAAAEAAERVWGVQRVIDLLVVRSAGASGSDDAGLARSAGSMLDWSVDVPLNAVKAEVKERKVTLTGVVTWDFQRVAADRSVRALRGITGVDNRVTIPRERLRVGPQGRGAGGDPPHHAHRRPDDHR
jgi:osmotically-inducible protein OsmY